jgi:hypothetical protein
VHFPGKPFALFEHGDAALSLKKPGLLHGDRGQVCETGEEIQIILTQLSRVAYRQAQLSYLL